jgi:hypothetical protein
MKTLQTEITSTARVISKILLKPRYLFITLSAGFIILGLLLWLFTFQTLLYVLNAPFLPISQKIAYFFSGYSNSVLYVLRDPIVFTRDAFVIVAAVNVTVFMFVRRHRRGYNQKSRSGASGLAVGLIAAGCVACGTSIIAPLFAVVGATASAATSQKIGVAGNIIGIVITLYSLYILGKQAAYFIPE